MELQPERAGRVPSLILLRNAIAELTCCHPHQPKFPSCTGSISMPPAADTTAFPQMLSSLPKWCPLALGASKPIPGSFHSTYPPIPALPRLVLSLKSSGCWDTGNKNHASSRSCLQMASLFPVSLARPLKNGGEPAQENTQRRGTEPAAPRTTDDPTGCPTEEIARAMLTASSLLAPTTG